MIRYKNTDYFITKDGKVYKNKKQLKSFFNEKGYERVSFYINKKIKKYFVHRLVAETFIKNPYNLPFVNHKNYKRNDNRVENLEWISLTNNNRNKKNYTKIDLHKAEEIRKSNLSQRKLAKLYNVSQTTICNIKNNNSWIL